VNWLKVRLIFMFNVFLSVLVSYLTYKQSLETCLSIGRSKLGILGENGLKPVIFFCRIMTVRLSERVSEQHSVLSDDCSLKRTGKRTCPEATDLSSLKQTLSERVSERAQF